MKLEDIHSVYFVGIGGIGMSAIARWFNQRGVAVGGYDRVETPLTTRMSLEGMWIHYVDDRKAIKPQFLNPESTLVVYTPAVPASHGELKFFQKKGFIVKKRSEVLGMISRGHYTIAVGGTHGKTTTSSMVAHLLNQSAQKCSAFVGGIMANYDTNMLVADKEAPVVVEADEFDRSFHRLSPNYSIVTSVDPDHLDIYGTEEEMKKAFGHFLQLSGEEGKTLIHYKAAEKVNMHLEHLYYTYGIDAGDVQAKALRAVNGTFIFNYKGKEVIKDLKLSVPGFHNVENAVAAVTVALDMGMDPEVIKEGIASYRGVKRRFEYVIKEDKFTFIDDYAHHPTEISAFLRSVKALFPKKKLTAVFQPHLYSRTKDFQKGFAESLSLADEIILLDIYPAREEPIPGISSRVIFDQIFKEPKTLCEKSELMDVIKEKDVELLCTIGAGNIDMEVPKLKAHFLKHFDIEA
ncbi:UDP-N-acetylmuramate--L-alanine ligase [Marinoscillum furvescens]|uniref:UDP-N-acetylmuramate--L-alanine ligase n=1 Tax=Marinoscillum furvescens DSM 4134 TaxID=1122208 RepID=A0A3D9KXJ4_MARFU|nr:UDP-N-acetylmuramate--L-alanine ligase [Marinoscillum furvescens]RED92447.1 UDP-N-acetylmuramate--L-alanine ligase [Marinoscillum furvescens DSM 4134]